MQIIAIETANSNHGDFLKNMANAWLRAEPSNRIILENAWRDLINKYDLAKEYSKEIKEHYHEYEINLSLPPNSPPKRNP